MAGYKCPKCEHISEPFGKGTVQKVAKEYGVEVLGTIPLSEEIKKSVEKKKPYFPSYYQGPIKKATQKIIEAEVGKVSFWKKAIITAKRVAQERIVKLVADCIGIINTSVDISSIQKKHGLTGGRVVQIILTTRRGKILVDDYVKIENGQLVAVDEPKFVHGGFRVDLGTISAVILGKKIVGDKEIPYSMRKAWLTGKIKTFGEGCTPAFLFFLNDIWEQAQPQLVKKLGPFAKKILEWGL